jgi:hypothetical protein
MVTPLTAIRGTDILGMAIPGGVGRLLQEASSCSAGGASIIISMMVFTKVSSDPSPEVFTEEAVSTADRHPLPVGECKPGFREPGYRVTELTTLAL